MSEYAALVKSLKVHVSQLTQEQLVAAVRAIERLERQVTNRDGKWMDEDCFCKVCDGEISQVGHMKDKTSPPPDGRSGSGANRQ